MASTTFVDGSTTIYASWLNDVNVATYTTLPNFMTSVAATYAPLNSPTLVTPNLGVATATTINKITITTPATGATLTVPNGTTATVSGTNTGDQLTFKNFAVPSQSTIVASTGTDTLNITSSGSITLTTNAGTKTLTISSPASMVQLASVNVTAVATIDFLNLFTSSYDNYLIVMEGIKPASADTLALRFANSGTVDTGTNYTGTNTASANALTATSAFTNFLGTTVPSGFGGLSGHLLVCNANSTNHKGGSGGCSAQATATTTNNALSILGYFGGAVSGFRLYWSSANNFAAQGIIKVYGLVN